MKLWLIIVLAVISALMIFLIIPAVVVFILIFSRKKAAPFEEIDRKAFKDHYYWKYYDEIMPYREKLQKRDHYEVSVISYDGLKFYGDYYDQKSDCTAIIFHGLGADIYINCPSQAEMFLKNGFNVLLVRQRAHNKSEGRWTTIGFREQYDVITWVKWAHNHSSEKIILYGISMGAATLAMASDKLDLECVRGIVLDSCYYSIYEQMKSEIRKKHIPGILLPAQRVMVKLIFHEDIRSSTAGHLAHSKKPVMFIHGSADQTVDCKWSKVLYDACTSPKEYLIVEGANHSLSNIIDPNKVEKGVSDFIKKYF